ncbi:hypothetical protein [Propionimicrobium sp. PCR01-08-3]|uniref:hypothetical protein n=1 Tax=Propionimicrobium sp. PCR01-08-3 TaxID=3052086 RepID=UPI00255C5CE9|nr:hypothetical protein [Propionimicrobium sp. PCR01-08-3]WIY83019.1 hypothetical protein QQ658_01245 [Propionimicrobium sp. PCR01-08-3]
MWIFTTKGFISLVQDRNDHSMLQVRARDPQDLRALFPHAEVAETPDADYRYRARVPRQEVCEVLTDAINEIDYESHFKEAAIATAERTYKQHATRLRWALYQVWEAMRNLQGDEPDYGEMARMARVFREHPEGPDEAIRVAYAEAGYPGSGPNGLVTPNDAWKIANRAWRGGYDLGPTVGPYKEA